MKGDLDRGCHKQNCGQDQGLWSEVLRVRTVHVSSLAGGGQLSGGLALFPFPNKHRPCEWPWDDLQLGVGH